jgi:hypothetical protein
MVTASQRGIRVLGSKIYLVACGDVDDLRATGAILA